LFAVDKCNTFAISWLTQYYNICKLLPLWTKLYHQQKAVLIKFGLHKSFINSKKNNDLKWSLGNPRNNWFHKWFDVSLLNVMFSTWKLWPYYFKHVFPYSVVLKFYQQYGVIQKAFLKS